MPNWFDSPIYRAVVFQSSIAALVIVAVVAILNQGL
jgi:low affinity Fe/Cu permease